MNVSNGVELNRFKLGGLREVNRRIGFACSIHSTESFNLMVLPRRMS